MNTSYTPSYKNAYRQAANTQHQFHQYVHENPYDPAAKAMSFQMHALTTDIAHGRDQGAIDKRVRNIKTMVRRSQATGLGGTPQSSVLNRSQGQMLNRNLDSMLKTIQRPGLK